MSTKNTSARYFLPIFFLFALFFFYSGFAFADDVIDQISPVANDWRPLSGRQKLGQIFLTGDNVTRIPKIEIMAMRKSDASIGKLALSLYEWKGNYTTTVAEKCVKKAMAGPADGRWISFALDADVRPRTPYYFEIMVSDASGDEQPVKSGKHFYYVWENHGAGGYLTFFNYSMEVIGGQLEFYNDLVFRTYCPAGQKKETVETSGPAVKNPRVGSDRHLTSLSMTVAEAQAMMREGIPPIVRNTDVLLLWTGGTEREELREITRYLHQYGILAVVIATVGNGLGDSPLKRGNDPAILPDTAYQKALVNNVREYVRATGVDGIYFDEPNSGMYNDARAVVYQKPEVVALFRAYIEKNAGAGEMADLLKENAVSSISALNPPSSEELKKGEKKLVCGYFARFRAHCLGELMKIAWDAVQSENPTSFNMTCISPYSLWSGRMIGPPDLHTILSFGSVAAAGFDCYETYGSGESSIRPHDAHLYYSWGASVARRYGKYFFSVSAPHYNRARHSATWADALFSGLRAGTETHIWNWRWLLLDGWKKEMDLQYVDMSERAFDYVRRMKREERSPDFALVFPAAIFYSGESTLGAFRYYGFGAFSRSAMENRYDYDVVDSSFLEDPADLARYRGLVIFGGLNSSGELAGLKKFVSSKGKFVYLVPDDGGIFASTDQYGRKRGEPYALKDIAGCDLIAGGTAGPGLVGKAGLTTTGKSIEFSVRKAVRFHCENLVDTADIWVKNQEGKPQFICREYEGNLIFIDCSLRDPDLFRDALARAGIKDEPLVVRKFKNSAIVFNREKEDKSVTVNLSPGNYSVAAAFDGEFKAVKYPEVVCRNEGAGTTVQMTVPAQSHVFLTGR